MNTEVRMYAMLRYLSRFAPAAGAIGLVIFLIGMSIFLTGCGDDPKSEPAVKKPKIVKRAISTPTPNNNPATTGNQPEAVAAVNSQKEKDSSIVTSNLPEIAKALPKGNFYTISPGDNLASIAAKQTIYKDPVKWTLLLRSNLDALSYLKSSPKLPHTTLRKGTRLTIPALNKSNAKPAKPWVVNVMSSPIPDLIYAGAAVLIRNGYAAYIIDFKHKGKKWMRLRVGFFKTRKEALAVGEKIKPILKLKDSWVIKIGAGEAVHDIS